MNKYHKQTIKRLFSYIKQYPLYFFGSVFFIIIGSIAVIVFNASLSPLFDMLLSNYSHKSFLSYIVQLSSIALFITMTHYLGLNLQGKLAEHVIYHMRKDVFGHIQKLPMSFFDRNPQGEIMSTITNDIATLNIALEESLSQLVNSIVTIIGTFTMMMVLSIPLTIVIVGMMSIIMFVVKFIGRTSSKSYQEQQAKLGHMNAYIVEMMSGQKVIKVFHREEAIKKEFGVHNESLRKVSTRASIFGIMISPMIGGLSYVAYAIVAVLGGYFVVIASMSIGNIAAYLQFTRTFFNPITQVSNQLNTVLSALAGAQRIFDILDIEIEVDEGNTQLINKNNNKYWKQQDDTLVKMRGAMSFDHVYFGYEQHHPILKDINLVVTPGQKIAFVGSTGAGKTTITNLINRFYEITGGAILLDGIDIRDIKKHDLRATMSMVLQDINLFEGSIKENIRYGRLHASDEDVVSAAKLANADYFINNLPEGYDTMLCENGENLSKGERQLLAIARAAIADPTILILDEATSSVDTRTEQLISKGMEKLMENRTTFVIAHRLSTVRDADAIMVLDHGEIIERGTHEQLMKQKGKYYNLNIGTSDLN